MTESKLARQLAAMHSREQERFRQFVASPYFNQHQTTQQLLDLLLEGIEQGGDALDRKRLFRKLFGRNTPYKEQRLADLMSGLMKLLGQFLSVEQLKEEPLMAEVLTLRRAEANGRYDFLKSRYKRLGRMLKESDFRDKKVLEASYLSNSIYGYYRTYHEDRGDQKTVQGMFYDLDRYYVLEKLRHACHMSANMLVMNTTYDFSLLDQVLNFMKSEQGQELFEHEPSIRCYYHILMTMRDSENLQHYERLLEFLNSGLDQLAPAEQRDLYLFANNYCILRIRQGDQRFPRELFDLFQRGITTGLIYQRNQIDEWAYKNVVTLGSKLGEYEWTEDFIESHYEKLPENRRDNAYTLNKAQFLYSRGRYEEAGDLLREVNDSDVKYHLARVLLQVRIAYEQKESTYLLNQLETFRLYVLRQKKISTNDKRSYINYSRFAKQLVNLRFQSQYYDKEVFKRKLEALHQKIVATKLLVGREWLITESRPQ